MNFFSDDKIRFTWGFNTSVVLALFILFSALPAHAGESLTSNHEINQQLNLSTGFESNRTMGERWELRGVYQLEYDTHYRLQTGLSYNGETGYINGIFIELGYEKIKDSDYSVRLKFLGNQYAHDNSTYNSIIPYLHWKAANYLVDIGLNYRYDLFLEDDLWNIFNYDADVSEVILYYRLGWRYPLPDDRYILSVEFKNNHEFYAGNLGAYALFINNSYQVNDRVKIYGNLGLWQSGSIGLSATYLKTTLHAGVEVRL